MSDPVVRDLRTNPRATPRSKPMKKRSKKKARNDNPAKKKPSKRGRAKNPGQKKSGAKRRASRKANPSRKHGRKHGRKKNMTTRAGDKRYARKRKHPRKANPHGKRGRHGRKRNMTTRAGDKRYARRRKHRSDNPLGLRLGNPTGNWGNIVALGVASLGGYIAAEFLDRFVATRAGGKSPNKGADAFTGADAITEITAPPDGMRMAAQGGLSLAFLVGGFWAAKKKHDTIAYIATGAGIGAGLHLAAQIWYDNVVPMFATHAKAGEKPTFLGDRIYPDLDKDALKAASEKAKALRTSGHPTLGAAPRPAAPRPATGPVGQPRVAPRPAPAVGCGADYSQMAMIQQLQQQNKALADQLAAKAAGVSAGPETRQPEPVAAPAPAPASRSNVSPIQKRFAVFG